MNLNDHMQFDHVIQVDADHNVSDAPDDVWPPEIDDGDRVEQDGGWSLMNGFSGQYLYSGPTMHSSEYIGGNLERAILECPGYYVAVVVPDRDGGEEPEGWAVAFKEFESEGK
jgi:hypothetical protein